MSERPVTPRTNTSFGPLKKIDYRFLNFGYAEIGPAHAAVSITPQPAGHSLVIYFGNRPGRIDFTVQRLL